MTDLTSNHRSAFTRPVHREMKPSPYETRKRVPDTPQKANSAFSRASSEKKLLFSSGKNKSAGRGNKRQKEEEGGTSPPPHLNWSVEATGGEMEEEDSSKLDKNDDFPAYFTVSDRAPLGEGKFGSVKCVRCTANQQEYALKETKKEVTQKSAMREIELWAQLVHPRIVPLFRAWYENNHAYFLMKLCEHPMSRFTEIWYKLQGVMDSDVLLLALKDCCSGLEYMHSKGIVHMDIKPSNMYVCKGRVVLGDFGMASRVGEAFPDTDRVYVAPEVFALNYACSPSADIFSLGLSFLEMGSNATPDELQNFRNSLNVDYFPQLERSHPVLFEYVRECVKAASEERPSATQILKTAMLQKLESTISQLYLPERYVEPRYQPPRSESVNLYMSAMSPMQSRSASRSGSPGMGCTSPDELSDRFASSAVVTPRSNSLQMYASPVFNGSPRASPLPRASPAPLSNAIGSGVLVASSTPSPRSCCTSPVFITKRLSNTIG